MINKELLAFNVLTKPEKDLYTRIQSNAKFKSIEDIIKTRVGINNFYNFSITIKSTIIMRDIILNSQFISGWARSSQVLNDNDSKFAVYKFLTRDKEQTDNWIRMMEGLEAAGHSMDNMRSLIYLDSIGDYAISVDILHIVYLTLILDSMSKYVTNSDFRDEIEYFRDCFGTLLTEYDIDYHKFDTMLPYAVQDFPVINTKIKQDISAITKTDIYPVNATYSVVGQLFRHRTIIKTYTCQSYEEEVLLAQEYTTDYNYEDIGLHQDIAEKIKQFTANAKSMYDLCQGSIVPIVMTGTTGAIHKALCQRTCYINDSPQFKDAFNDFAKRYEGNKELELMPPCKFNGNNCYVGYVNESRRKGEEKTQIPCPIYCKAKGYTDDFDKAVEAPKTQWYIENLNYWSNVCKH